MDAITTQKQANRPPFCGLQEVLQRLKAISLETPDRQKFDEIFAVIEELYSLDDSLVRLRYERHFVDEQDIDQVIDRLRGTRQGGA